VFPASKVAAKLPVGGLLTKTPNKQNIVKLSAPKASSEKEKSPEEHHSVKPFDPKASSDEEGRPEKCCSVKPSAQKSSGKEEESPKKRGSVKSVVKDSDDKEESPKKRRSVKSIVKDINDKEESAKKRRNVKSVLKDGDDQEESPKKRRSARLCVSKASGINEEVVHEPQHQVTTPVKETLDSHDGQNKENDGNAVVAEKISRMSIHSPTPKMVITTPPPDTVPAQFSPFIVTGRGADRHNRRRSRKFMIRNFETFFYSVTSTKHSFFQVEICLCKLIHRKP